MLKSLLCLWRKILSHFFTGSWLIFNRKEFKLYKGGCGRVGARRVLENRHCKLRSTEYVKDALWFARHSLNFVPRKRGVEKENILPKYSVKVSTQQQQQQPGSGVISTRSAAHSANKGEHGEAGAEWSFSEFPRHVGGCLWVFVFSLASLGRINMTRVTLVWVSHRTEHLRLWARSGSGGTQSTGKKRELFQIYYIFSST